MMQLVRTIKDKIVIRADLEVRKLSSIIAVTEKKLTFVGTVLLVGPEVKEIKVGDRVHYGNDRKPIKVDTEHEDIIVIREQDVFVVVTNV